jgi:hypothetical protein
MQDLIILAVVIIIVIVLIVQPKFPKGKNANTNVERLQDVGRCSYICDHRPGGQGCAQCLNTQSPTSNQNLRGAVIGLLE